MVGRICSFCWGLLKLSLSLWIHISATMTFLSVLLPLKAINSNNFKKFLIYNEVVLKRVEEQKKLEISETWKRFTIGLPPRTRCGVLNSSDSAAEGRSCLTVEQSVATNLEIANNWVYPKLATFGFCTGIDLSYIIWRLCIH